MNDQRTPRPLGLGRLVGIMVAVIAVVVLFFAAVLIYASSLDTATARREFGDQLQQLGSIVGVITLVLVAAVVGISFLRRHRA